MLEASKHHPVRRIREAFRNASEESGLREFHTSAGFARLLHRAPSSIRNVESGQTRKWDRLAKRIEDCTGVSAKWMLGDPAPTAPILGTEGEPWDPEQLDALGGGGGNLNWRVLLMTSPQGAVRLAGRLVEKKLAEDLLGKDGGDSTRFLSELARLLAKHGALADQEVTALVGEVMAEDARRIAVDLAQLVRGGPRAPKRG